MYQYKGSDRPSAVERAMEQIIGYISDQGLGDGERLPTERELAELLGVGRSTLREALQRLSTRNVLEVRRGVGTFVSYKHGVADDPLGFTMIRDKERLARDLLEFRILIEPRTAALAAQHATEDDVAELEYLCDSVDELISTGRPHLERDQEFHTCIARCGGNIILPKLLPIIHGAIGVFIAETGGTAPGRDHAHPPGHPQRHPRPRPHGGLRRHVPPPHLQPGPHPARPHHPGRPVRRPGGRNGRELEFFDKNARMTAISLSSGRFLHCQTTDGARRRRGLTTTAFFHS